jgi:hypothetical protein
VRGKRRAEERASRAAEKAAKEESKRQEELRSYKGLMRVGASAVVVVMLLRCHLLLLTAELCLVVCADRRVMHKPYIHNVLELVYKLPCAV